MSTELQAHADLAYSDFTRVTADYCHDTADLTVNPRLLSHVDKILKKAMGVNKVRKSSGSVSFDTELYLVHIREGVPPLKAARLMGLEPKELRKRIEFDTAFREAVELAEQEASEEIEEKLWFIAQSGERWAMEMWLKNRMKKRWGDETVVRHEGTVTHELGASPLVEQILALQGMLNKRLELQSGDIIDAEEVDE